MNWGVNTQSTHFFVRWTCRFLGGPNGPKICGRKTKTDFKDWEYAFDIFHSAFWKIVFCDFCNGDMYHCIGLTKKGPVFLYFGFVATAFSFLQLWMRFIRIFQTLSFSFFSLLKKVAQPQPDTPGPSSIYVTGREKNRPIWGAQNSNSMQIFYQNWTTWYIAHCVLCKVHFLAQPNKLRPILKV